MLKNTSKYGNKTKNHDKNVNPFSQRKSKKSAHITVTIKCKIDVSIETRVQLSNMDTVPKKRLTNAGVHRPLTTETMSVI